MRDGELHRKEIKRQRVRYDFLTINSVAVMTHKAAKNSSCGKEKKWEKTKALLTQTKVSAMPKELSNISFFPIQQTPSQRETDLHLGRNGVGKSFNCLRFLSCLQVKISKCQVCLPIRPIQGLTDSISLVPHLPGNLFFTVQSPVAQNVLTAVFSLLSIQPIGQKFREIRHFTSFLLFHYSWLDLIS